jgi:hypothetical protein
MNSTEARELLERAAASVTPAETDPAGRMVRLGRRSVQRRRAWGAAGFVAAAVAAVVVLPLALAPPDRSLPAGPSTVNFGGLTVAVPDGWRTNRVAAFDPCTAEPHTVYLAGRWQLGYSGGRPSAAPAGAPVTCHSDDQAWIAIVQKGFGPELNPDRLVVKDGQLLQVERPFPDEIPFVWTYREQSDVIQAPTALIAGDEPGRDRLLQRVTWPAGPPAPPSGGLALPDRITSATTTVPPSNGMVVATDAKTLNRIRAKLAGLRDAVAAGQECTLQMPGLVGISLGEVTVVLGDATCPQAISTGGGRVRVPAGLGTELRDLIAASDRNASRK